MSVRKEHAVKAARHHSTLNALYAVIAVLEGGCIYDPAAQRTVQKIITLCKNEAAIQLRRYDVEIAKASS